MGKESDKAAVKEFSLEKIESFFSKLPESKYISHRHSIVYGDSWRGTLIDFGEGDVIHVSKEGDQYGHREILISVSQGGREFSVSTTPNFVIFKCLPQKATVSIGDNTFKLKSVPAEANWGLADTAERASFLDNFIGWVKDCIEKEEMIKIPLAFE